MTREEAINKLEYLINSPVGREEIDETCYEVMKYLAAQEPRSHIGFHATAKVTFGIVPRAEKRSIITMHGGHIKQRKSRLRL